VDNSASFATRLQSTYKSGKAVQTTGATSVGRRYIDLHRRFLEQLRVFAKAVNVDVLVAVFDEIKPACGRVFPAPTGPAKWFFHAALASYAESAHGCGSGSPGSAELMITSRLENHRGPGHRSTTSDDGADVWS
jgi:hypothetical protein